MSDCYGSRPLASACPPPERTRAMPQHDAHPVDGCDPRVFQGLNDAHDAAGIAVEKDPVVVVDIGSFPVGSLVGAHVVGVKGALSLLLDWIAEDPVVVGEAVGVAVLAQALHNPTNLRQVEGDIPAM